MDYQSLADAETTEPFDGVHLTKLASGETINMQHARFEPGTVVDEHSHPNEQVSFVLEGEVTFLVESEEITVEAGGSLAIPGDEPHGAANHGTEPAVVLESFHPPR